MVYTPINIFKHPKHINAAKYNICEKMKNFPRLSLLTTSDCSEYTVLFVKNLPMVHTHDIVEHKKPIRSSIWSFQLDIGTKIYGQNSDADCRKMAVLSIVRPVFISTLNGMQRNIKTKS